MEMINILLINHINVTVNVMCTDAILSNFYG